ncbi:hypothetical protein BY458DRAFT_560781 [Sporodiniella umbellata]|nr:hypothetical protein BY458DRAFT_560781 [Sporodiniella umbellata]
MKKIGTKATNWDWFTELHSSRSICLQPVRKSDGLIFLTLCLRYMIAESTYEPEKLADHEVLALVLACLVCLAPSLGFEESKLECGKPALNRRSVHILAQYQTVVYSSYILSQILPIEIQAPLLQLYHGPYFHYCLEKTRGGDGIGSLLPDVSPEFVTLLNKVYRLTTQNLEIRRM